jgi:hypothetical protein
MSLWARSMHHIIAHAGLLGRPPPGHQLRPVRFTKGVWRNRACNFLDLVRVLSHVHCLVCWAQPSRQLSADNYHTELIRKHAIQACAHCRLLMP